MQDGKVISNDMAGVQRQALTDGKGEKAFHGRDPVQMVDTVAPSHARVS